MLQQTISEIIMQTIEKADGNEIVAIDSYDVDGVLKSVGYVDVDTAEQTFHWDIETEINKGVS